MLHLPCKKVFQLTSTENIEPFVDEVFVEVAQTLLELSTKAGDFDFTEERKAEIDVWLNAPILTQIQGGLQILGCGASGGYTSTVNTSAGFDRSGFRTAVCNLVT